MIQWNIKIRYYIIPLTIFKTKYKHCRTTDPHNDTVKANASEKIYLLFNQPSELAVLCADLIMHANPEHAISKSYDFFRSQFKEISGAAGIFIGVCLSGLLFEEVSAFFSPKWLNMLT